MEPIRIRPASLADLPAINDIYNYYVINSTCTYQTEEDSIETRQSWFAERAAAHPVTVAEINGQIAGWGSLSRFRTRSAYDRTVENAVYVDHRFHRRGIGTAILVDLINRAKMLDHHTIIAVISAEQAASIALHEQMEFIHAGRLKEVGFKMGRWLDVVYLQRTSSS